MSRLHPPRLRLDRVNKVRLGLTLLALSILAVVSTVFGMMMAVAQDLPDLEAQNQFKEARNSVLLDDQGRKLAVLTGKDNRILVRSDQISQDVKQAVIAIEDRRFYKHKGVDYQGIARAVWEDILRRQAAQGGSTITEQFVKNALLAQKNRTIFQKLKEAALAYQLERKWTKDKILTEYLNTVYFGEGAYGVESAARVYFGWNHPGCEPNCAAVLEPAESALLAGMIASPSAYNPIQNPAAALERRNLVLKEMRDANALAPSEYDDAAHQALPPRNRIRTPRKISKAPYFSSWVEDQLVARYGTGTTFGGGLKIRTTLDLDFQQAAEQAIAGRLAGVGPSAVAGRDRQQDRRRPGDGRRLRLRAQRPSTSPRRGTASPARRSSRSRWWPRFRTASRRAGRSCRGRRDPRARAGCSRSRTTTTATRA